MVSRRLTGFITPALLEGSFFFGGQHMKELVLSRGKVAQVDDTDFEWLSEWKWSYFSGGYAVSRTKGKFVYLHRVILGCQTREEWCDHINGDRLDNRRANLRHANRATNTYNKGKERKNTSGFKGVTWDKKKEVWAGQISKNGKHFHLGYFTDPSEAHEQYCIKAKELFGEYARFE